MKLRELLHILEQTAAKNKAPQVVICGGVARDKYMGLLQNIEDVDLTNGTKSISFVSQEFANELKKTYNLTYKTMEDGHSTIFIGNLKMDFSSNFNVPNIENILKKQGIEYPTEMQKEVYSRDFTCNSLLMSLDLKNIMDPTKKGFQDIKDKKIKTCLSPEITLTSNRNRVIRAVYLASKLQFDIDDNIIKYVQKFPETVKISTEKALSDKLNEAFTYDAERASHNLTQMKLWNYIPITEKVYPYYIKNVKGGK